MKNSLIEALLYAGIAFLLMIIVFFMAGPMNAYAEQGWGLFTVIVVGGVFLKKLF